MERMAYGCLGQIFYKTQRGNQKGFFMLQKDLDKIRGEAYFHIWSFSMVQFQNFFE